MSHLNYLAGNCCGHEEDDCYPALNRLFGTRTCFATSLDLSKDDCYTVLTMGVNSKMIVNCIIKAHMFCLEFYIKAHIYPFQP